MNDIEKIDKLIAHIRGVQDNCLILGKKLIEKGDFVLGRNLIVNSMSHDLTKFFGVEYEDLHKDAEKDDLKVAIHQHNSSNKHHIEFWGNAEKMEDVFIAEMVCDTVTRSQELAVNYLDWLTKEAPKRYKFSKKGKFLKKALYFYNLLIENPFKDIK